MAIRPGTRFRNPVRDPFNVRVSTAVASWVNFSPASIPDLQIWLDAADTSTITESSGSVSQWNDKSGLGRHVAQGTGAAQPTTGTRTLNGLNVLDFDGGDSLISGAAASTWKFLHDGTVHLVATVAARDVAGVNGTIYGTSNAATSVGITLRWLGSGAQGANNIIDYQDNGAVNNEFSVGTTTDPRIFSIYSDMSNATAANRALTYVDTGNFSAVNNLTGTPSASNPPVSLTLGNRQVNAVPLDGYIAEFIVVGPAGATINNLLLLRRYLSNKWGIKY